MMHVTISYPLPDNQLLTQLFTALEEESVNVDMISQIVNLEGLQLSFSIKDSDAHQISSILENLSIHFSALDYKINEAYVKNIFNWIRYERYVRSSIKSFYDAYQFRYSILSNDDIGN